MIRGEAKAVVQDVAVQDVAPFYCIMMDTSLTREVIILVRWHIANNVPLPEGRIICWFPLLAAGRAAMKDFGFCKNLARTFQCTSYLLGNMLGLKSYRCSSRFVREEEEMLLLVISRQPLRVQVP